MAKHKKHSTVNQALKIAKYCKAWRTILTHFSIRDQKSSHSLELKTKALAAHDHMRLSLKSLEWAYHLNNFYSIFNQDRYKEQDELDKVARSHRKLQKQSS